MSVACEIDYVPCPRAAAIYERAKEVAEGSLNALMQSEGFTPYIIEQSLKGDSASEHEADLLRIPVGEAGLRLTCTTFAQTGAPIEYTEAFYPGSPCEVHCSLHVTK